MIIHRSDLQSFANQTAWQFQGYQHGDVNVSFIINETQPGGGPKLHRHTYPEVFILLDGQLTFTLGDEQILVSAGQIVIAPADTPHKFINSGTQVARHVDIHTSPRMITTWLEE